MATQLPSSPSPTVAARAGAQDAHAALAQVLPEDFDECVALYFDCETAEERDGFLRCLATRPGSDVDAFLLAMVAEDEDPFVRLQAARLLGSRGIEAGRNAVAECLAVSHDDDLLAEAIDAWVALNGPAAVTELASICRDVDRTHGERSLAQQGLLRADVDAAASMFALLLEQAAGQPLDGDLVENMMPAFVGNAALLPRVTAALRKRVEEVAATLPALQAQVDAAQDEDARERAQDRVDEARDAQQISIGCLALLAAEL